MSETHRDTLKIALSGGPARQKTRQIAHLIREFGAERVAILSCEAGLNTIASSLAGVRVWPVDSMNDVRQVWSEMAAFAKTPDVWLCIDGGTTLLTWSEMEVQNGTVEFWNRYITKQEIPAALKPYQRMVSHKKETIDPFAVYAEVGRRITSLYQEVLRLGCNFYINFMEEKVGKNEMGEKSLPYGWEIPGNVGKSFILAKTDFVGHLYYDDSDKLVCCWNRACRIHQTKTRDDKVVTQIPAEISEFDLGKFVRLIQPAG